MSVVRTDRCKVFLPRQGADPFWSTIREQFAGSDAQVWRRLAMFALKDGLSWPLDQIALVFELSSGHVSRSVTEIKRDLRMQFRPEELADTAENDD